MIGLAEGFPPGVAGLGRPAAQPRAVRRLRSLSRSGGGLPPNGRELTASVGASLVLNLPNSSFTRSTEFTVSILRIRTREAAEPLAEPDRPASTEMR